MHVNQMTRFKDLAPTEDSIQAPNSFLDLASKPARQTWENKILLKSSTIDDAKVGTALTYENASVKNKLQPSSYSNILNSKKVTVMPMSEQASDMMAFASH